MVKTYFLVEQNHQRVNAVVVGGPVQRQATFLVLHVRIGAVLQQQQSTQEINDNSTLNVNK